MIQLNKSKQLLNNKYKTLCLHTPKKSRCRVQKHTSRYYSPISCIIRPSLPAARPQDLGDRTRLIGEGTGSHETMETTYPNSGRGQVPMKQ